MMHSPEQGRPLKHPQQPPLEHPLGYRLGLAVVVGGGAGGALSSTSPDPPTMLGLV